MTTKTLDIGVISKSQALRGLKVGFGLCGGIGSVDSVRSIRELRRHGAEVFPWMTPEASEFITEKSVAWAAGRHVSKGPASEPAHLSPLDLLVVAPATLNTMAKASQVISDNPLTLLISSLIGAGIPILWVPTMNSQMAAHPGYPRICETLQEWGGVLYPSPQEESRLKMPEPEHLAEFVCQNWGRLAD